MQLHQVRVPCRPAADDVNFAVESDHARVVSRRRKRSGYAPFSRRGIIDLVRLDGDLIEAAPAYGVQLSAHEGRANRSARAAERRKGAPLVRRDIVFECHVYGSSLRHPSKASQHINFPIACGNAWMAFDILLSLMGEDSMLKIMHFA
jgi:hypothetical protein